MKRRRTLFGGFSFFIRWLTGTLPATVSPCKGCGCLLEDDCWGLCPVCFAQPVTIEAIEAEFEVP